MTTLRLSPRVEFTELASKYDAVNLGQGFPDYPPPDFVSEAFQHAISGDFMLYQYTRPFVSLPVQCWTVCFMGARILSGPPPPRPHPGHGTGLAASVVGDERTNYARADFAPGLPLEVARIAWV